MPEYIPRLDLSPGLAAQAFQTRANTPSPWAALAETLGKLGQQYGQQAMQQRLLEQGQLTIPQAKFIQAGMPTTDLPQIPAGRPGAGQVPGTYSQDVQNSFPGGRMPKAAQEYMEQISKQKEAESLNQMTTSRVLGAAGIKANEAENKAAMDMVPLTPETRATLKKSGIVLPDSINNVHRSLLASVAGVDGKQESAALSRSLALDKLTQSQLKSMMEALDPSKARSGSFGVSKNVFDRAERLQSLAVAAIGNPDKRQMEELAIGLNAMLSGSNTGAQEQVKQLVPQSLVGNANKLKEWLTNEPVGTGQQEFVKRLSDTVAREKATAADQIKRTQMQRVSAYTKLEKSAPDEFKNALQSFGIEPDEYRKWKEGGFKQKTAVQSLDGSDSSGGKAPHQLSDQELLNAL